MREYDRREERTGVQENRDWAPEYDVQSDFVMVYGFHDLESEQTYRKIGGFLMKPENCTYYIGEADPPVEAETEPIS